MRGRRLKSALLFAAAIALGCGSESPGDPRPDETAPEDHKPAASEDDKTRVIFDFVANRVLAHRFEGETWIAEARFGHFDKLIPFDRGGWRLVRSDGIEFAQLVASSAALRVPERSIAAEPDRIRLLFSSKRKGTLTISSGGKRIASIRLSGGWQGLEVTLTGKVASDLSFSASRQSELSLLALALGRGDLAPLGSPDEEPAKARLVLRPGETLSYYVHAPAETVISGTARGCVVLGAIHEPGSVGELVELPIRIEKSAPAVRIDIGVAECGLGTIDTLVMRGPRPATRESVGAVPAKHVILWVMDTLRADRIAPINPKARAEVSGFERLAQRGVVFRRAWSAGNESKASHASLWTSVYPAVHEIRTAGRPGEWQLKNRLLTMGTLARAAGKRPIALTANGMVTKHAGYSRGFATFENPMRDGTGKRRNGWIPSEKLYGRALELLEPVAGDPFFFFFGTIDTHKPWVGHQPWLDRYDSGYRGPFVKAAYPGQLGIKAGSMQCTVVPKPRDLARINAIYDSAISYQDAHLAKMLDWLGERGLLEDTLIIVTSDHGEELWEVGRCGHGSSLRETLLNIPLFVSYPKALPSGLVVEEGVDGVDVLPTILELLGVAIPEDFQGASLAPLANAAGAGYPRASYASQYEYAHAMRVGDLKIRVGKGARFYDLAADPRELDDVAGERPMAEQQLGDALSLFLRNRKRWRKWKWGVANNLTPEGALALENR